MQSAEIKLNFSSIIQGWRKGDGEIKINQQIDKDLDQLQHRNQDKQISQLQNQFDSFNASSPLSSLQDEEDDIFSSRKEKFHKKQDSHMNNEDEDGAFWNCDPALTVKELLMVSTKENQKQVNNFRRGLQEKLIEYNKKQINEFDNEKQMLDVDESKRNKTSSRVRVQSLNQKKQFFQKTLINSEQISNLQIEEYNSKDFEINHRMQHLKLSKIRDAYQENLSNIIQEKNNLTKNLHDLTQEKKQLKKEVKYLTNKFDIELKNLKFRLEEEYKTNFVDKEQAMKAKFQSEIQELISKYYELKLLCSKKDGIIYNLCGLIMHQEKDLANLMLQFRNMSKQDIMKTIINKQPSKLNIFGNTFQQQVKDSLMLQVEEDRKLKQKSDSGPLENEERRCYEDKVYHLEEQIVLLNQIIQNWIDELDRANKELKELRETQERMQVQHQIEIMEQKRRLESNIDKLQSELDSTKHKLNNVQDHMKCELTIKDEIDNRKEEYIELLKKELTIAKNIIKHPRLKDKAFKLMNFDREVYYEYAPVKKQQQNHQQLSYVKQDLSLRKTSQSKDNDASESCDEVPNCSSMQGGGAIEILSKNYDVSQFIKVID